MRAGGIETLKAMDEAIRSRLEGDLYLRANGDYVVITGISYYHPGRVLYVGIVLPSGSMLRIHPRRLTDEQGFRFVTHFTTIQAYLADPQGYMTVATKWLKKRGL